MKKYVIIFLSVFCLFLLVVIGYINYPKNVIVEIKGDVVNPGVYTLKKNSTVKDLIDASGGVLENVDTYTINMSKKLVDGMVVVMYPNENFEVDDNVNYYIIKPDIENNMLFDEYVTNEIWESSKISINKADALKLMELPGIGEAKASAIIEYRNNNGLFKSIEDIKNVKGIGNSIYEKIKDYITV